MARIAQRFAARLPERIDAIDAAIDTLSTGAASETPGDLERMLHDMAGTAPILGYEVLGTMARRGEDMIAARRSSAGNANHESTQALLDQLRQLRLEAQRQMDERA
nr:Hpt domain-containing protein [Stakelama flava]